jgi:hypothetical protein
MASRPCKPSSDTKDLWQWLLPQTPFPACGTGEEDAGETKNDDSKQEDAAAPEPIPLIPKR